MLGTEGTRLSKGQLAVRRGGGCPRDSLQFAEAANCWSDRRVGPWVPSPSVALAEDLA